MPVTITNGRKTLRVNDSKFALRKEYYAKNGWYVDGEEPIQTQASEEIVVQSAAPVQTSAPEDVSADQAEVELETKAPVVEESTDAVIPSDLTCPHCNATARSEKSYIKNHGENCSRNPSNM
tara:strand:+ start:139 stop:504 length:366 start_codon:yes stop_codon:yes gene_type:complete